MKAERNVCGLSYGRGPIGVVLPHVLISLDVLNFRTCMHLLCALLVDCVKIVLSPQICTECEEKANPQRIQRSFSLRALFFHLHVCNDTARVSYL